MAPDALHQTLRGRKVFDLGVELYHGMPHVPLHSPFMYEMVRTHGDLMYGEGVTAAVDIFSMSCHTGTHLDGFGHFANSVQTGQPGLNLEAARWLTDRGAFCIGSDNFAVEYTPTPNNGHPVHVHCLVEKGVHLLEVANFEDLSGTRTYEFLLVIVPMKLRGGTASPVRPLAVV